MKENTLQMPVQQRLPTFLIRLIPHFMIRYYQQINEDDLFRGEDSFSRKSILVETLFFFFLLLRPRWHKSIPLTLVLLLGVTSCHVTGINVTLLHVTDLLLVVLNRRGPLVEYIHRWMCPSSKVRRFLVGVLLQ